jgi:hypothetical protein
VNLSDIKKNKFWISLGGVMISMIALHLFVVNPFRLKNIKKAETIENVLARLERYERKGVKLRNAKWIKAEEDKLATIKEARREYEVFYKERDRHLEKVFTSVNGEEIKDEALWQNRYIQEGNVLLDKIKNHNIALSENTLPFKEWKAAIPTWEDIVPEQKRFWIAEELINIILKKEMNVRYLESINFGKEKAPHANAHAELFDIIPFSIKVRMNVEGLLFLINEFLKSKICFEIETINVSGELNRLRSPKGAEKSYQTVHINNIQSPSMVDVVIEAYVVDFKI